MCCLLRALSEYGSEVNERQRPTRALAPRSNWKHSMHTRNLASFLERGFPASRHVRRGSGFSPDIWAHPPTSSIVQLPLFQEEFNYPASRNVVIILPEIVCLQLL